MDFLKALLSKQYGTIIKNTLKKNTRLQPRD